MNHTQFRSHMHPRCFIRTRVLKKPRPNWALCCIVGASVFLVLLVMVYKLTGPAQ
jgi:hypothetical protein